MIYLKIINILISISININFAISYGSDYKKVAKPKIATFNNIQESVIRYTL